jgi:hypothetical protein
MKPAAWPLRCSMRQCLLDGDERIYGITLRATQDAIPLPPNGGCPDAWTRGGSFCPRSGSGR